MDWDYERSRCWFPNDARTPEWKATAGNLPASAPTLAGLMVTLKAECEAQHARAEAAESRIAALEATLQRYQDGSLLGKHGREQADRIAALEAERDDWKYKYEQAADDRAHCIEKSDAYEAALSTRTQEREEARAGLQLEQQSRDADHKAMQMLIDHRAAVESTLTTMVAAWKDLLMQRDALQSTLATVAQALEGLEKEWRAAAIVDESLPAWACADEVAAVRALIPPGKEPT